MLIVGYESMVSFNPAGSVFRGTLVGLNDRFRLLRARRSAASPDGTRSLAVLPVGCAPWRPVEVSRVSADSYIQITPDVIFGR